jgi:hypothetical protein
MGAQVLQRGQIRRRFNLQASEGTVQEMLPHQPSPVQVVQWPLEKYLMTAQIVPTKIEYEHCITFGLALPMNSNNCKQV